MKQLRIPLQLNVIIAIRKNCFIVYPCCVQGLTLETTDYNIERHIITIFIVIICCYFLAPPRHIYESFAYRRRMSVIVHDYGLRQLAAFYCLEFRPPPSAKFRVQRTCGVKQFATRLAREYVTVYVQDETEDASAQTITMTTKTIRRCCGVFS